MMLEHLGGRFGYRGLWLMVTGTAWIVFGFGVLYAPTPERPWLLHEVPPDGLQACGWWITGVVAFWQGTRGPNRVDALGHVGLYLMPAIRFLSFSLAFVLYVSTLALRGLGADVPVIGYADAWFAALVWLMFSLMLIVAASWPNPNPPLPKPPPERR